MKKIKYEDIGSILNPQKNLQFFARKPVTEPLGPRPAQKFTGASILMIWKNASAAVPVRRSAIMRLLPWSRYRI